MKKKKIDNYLFKNKGVRIILFTRTFKWSNIRSPI